MWLIVLQLVIIAMGTTAKVLVGSRKYNKRRWGYIVGISTEVLWAVLFIATKLPLMVGLCFLYTFGWWTGLHRHPRRAKYEVSADEAYGRDQTARKLLVKEDIRAEIEKGHYDTAEGSGRKTPQEEG
jgi:hypothetical protein